MLPISKVCPFLLVLLPLTVVGADGNATIRIEAYVAAYQKMAAYDGVVLIAEGDEIVYLKAFGFADYEQSQPMSVDTVFRIASLSKQVTMGAVGRLVDQKKLSFDATLDAFLPDYPNADRISIRQLLEHSAGIAHTNNLEWLDMQVAMPLDDIVANLAVEELLFAPGTDERYSNGGYALLAKIIEIVSGQSYGEFIQAEFAASGFASLGHEDAGEEVPGMAGRYAPGPVYGQRVPAETYITANRIGGGSLHANARDVWRFFRASYGGELVASSSTAALFRKPDDGDIEITGRSPGTLAQVYLDFETDLSVVTLSSNTAWPGSFNADIVALYRGEDASLTPFELSHEALSESDLVAFTGQFVAERFGWNVAIEATEHNLVFVQGDMRTAFARTRDGEFHLPVYDWLCRYGDYGMNFECRQRDPDASIRFVFRRI